MASLIVYYNEDFSHEKQYCSHCHGLIYETDKPPKKNRVKWKNLSSLSMMIDTSITKYIFKPECCRLCGDKFVKKKNVFSQQELLQSFKEDSYAS